MSVTVNIDNLKNVLPERATIKIVKKYGTLAIECFVPSPSLEENEFDTCLESIRGVIGKNNISEFYTEETGRHWYIFLKQTPLTLTI